MYFSQIVTLIFFFFLQLKFNNLYEFYTHYCLVDSILLAEVIKGELKKMTKLIFFVQVFHEFRLQCKRTFEILPDAFITLPGYSIQAAAKFCDLSLDLISDKDVYEVCIHIFLQKSNLQILKFFTVAALNKIVIFC